MFFTSGGSEAVESAWKLAKSYYAARGEPKRHKIISRFLAYHGTSMGALTATGLPALREPFEPLTPGGRHAANTNSYRWKEDRDPLWAADSIEEAILFEGPATVAAVILEPVQNGGGCFVPQDGYFQRVREICDRHGVLLISDEVICSWGRLGYWFGCERYDYQPDMITTAKGITSAYAPMGAVIAGDHIAEPFLHGKAIFNHGFTFGGHPIACAMALANIDVIEREGLCERVLAERRALARDAREPARPADRRRRARRRLLPGDRAGEGQGDEGDVQPRGGRGAAARVPLRRAVPPRADLPDRRPRRPDRAALAAADRGRGAVRGDRVDSAPGAERGLGAGGEMELTVESLIAELGLELVDRSGVGAGARAVGAQHRAASTRRRG